MKGHIDYTNPITIGVILLLLGAALFLAVVFVTAGPGWATVILSIVLVASGIVALSIGLTS